MTAPLPEHLPPNLQGGGHERWTDEMIEAGQSSAQKGQNKRESKIFARTWHGAPGVLAKVIPLMFLYINHGNWRKEEAKNIMQKKNDIFQLTERAIYPILPFSSRYCEE